MSIFNTLTIWLIYMLFETFGNKFPSMLSIFFEFVDFLCCLFLLFCYCYTCIYYSFFNFLLLLFYLSWLFIIKIFDPVLIWFNIHFISFSFWIASHSTHFLFILSLFKSLHFQNMFWLFLCLYLLYKICTFWCFSNTPLCLFFFFI